MRQQCCFENEVYAVAETLTYQGDKVMSNTWSGVGLHMLARRTDAARSHVLG